jgi:hypothetical protein
LAEGEKGVVFGRGGFGSGSAATSSLVLALTRALVLALVVAALIMVGMPAVLALGAGN